MTLSIKLIKPLALIWAAAIVGIVGLAMQTGLRFDSNIMALLPESQQEAHIQAATKQMSEQFSKQLLLLLSADDEATLRQAVPIVAQHLSGLDQVADIDWQLNPQHLNALQDELYPYRFSLLDPASRRYLLNKDFQSIKERALTALYNPLSAGKRSLVDDPFNFFLELNKNKAHNLQVRVADSLLKVQNAPKPTYLIALTLTEQPFSAAFQRAILNAINSHQDLFAASSIKLQMSGMLLHAELAARQANKEIFSIGIASMLAIIVLILLVFRRFKTVILLFIPLAIGCLVASSVTLIAFTKIHLITLAFGAGLIGVSIDYSLHFLCERRASAHATALAKILPALLLGLLSSVLAYTAQALSPFPGLQQMAVFSAVGLIASWLTVVLWLPWFTQYETQQELPAAALLNKSQLFFYRLGQQRLWPVLLAVLLALSVKTISDSSSLDDIRLLQTSPPSLLAEETNAQNLLGKSSSSQFLLISAKTLNECLQKEESISPLLNKWVSDGTLSGYQSLAQQLPSIERQQENLALVQQLYDQQLTAFYQQLGLTASQAANTLQSFNNKNHLALSSDIWLQQDSSKPLLNLLISSENANNQSTIIRFIGPIDDKAKVALHTLADTHDGIDYIDQVSSINQLIRTVRNEMTTLVLIAYAVVLLILFGRYKFQVWRVTLPPFLASIFTLALLVNIEQGLNLFHLMALLLVLGIGLDMGIFLNEKSHRSHTWLAVSLSSLTSLLAFGLLTFSQTPILHHFGLTTLIGLSLVWLLAPTMRKQPTGQTAQ